MQDSWTREDGSIVVDPGHGRHVDISTDGGDSWHALDTAEAREMAFALILAASTVETR